jgi:hypothetical protein
MGPLAGPSSELSGAAVGGENSTGADGVVGQGRRGAVGEGDPFHGVCSTSGDNSGGCLPNPSMRSSRRRGAAGYKEFCFISHDWRAAGLCYTKLNFALFLLGADLAFTSYYPPVTMIVSGISAARSREMPCRPRRRKLALAH